MKARSQELIKKSLAAMISAIELYNKPDFRYREETFAILAINAWELLLKAKWLKDHKNQVKSLYISEQSKRPNGKPYKHPKIKVTNCGNPFTHGLDYLAKKMEENKVLASAARKNIIALCEIRDSAVHFYNKSSIFAVRLQEVGSASVRNYVKAAQEWFEIDFTQYNFYLMPLAFVNAEISNNALLLNTEEKNLAAFISNLEAANDPQAEYTVSVNVELKFLKSKAEDAIKVQVTNDPNATKVQLTEQHIKDKFPLNYEMLTKECKKKYANFIVNKKYHDLRKPLKLDNKYCHVRVLDPDNPKSATQVWFSYAVFNIFDKHYEIKKS
jgi:hypothetical protein